MKSINYYFLTGLGCIVLGVTLDNPYLYILAGCLFLLNIADSYFMNRELLKVKEQNLKIEEALGRINKNEQTLAIAQKRLEDKFDALNQGTPFARKIQR